MSTQQHLDDHIIARYTAQPTRLPAELRRQIEHAWQGAPVQLYALADLDQGLRLTEAWLALGPRHVAVSKRMNDGAWDLRIIDRSQIQAIREAPGLSANTLTLLGAPGEPALALLRYTHRQRRAFENIRFVLEEQLAGHIRHLADVDADRLYAESVARPIRDAQALVSGRQTAVIRRLLGYLKPYRRQLTLGMAAATVITLVSLVPPYLAGHLIDRVVRPAQAGALSLARAATIAWLAVAAMALVYLVRQPAVHIRLRLMSIIGEWVARDLRAELYEHIQRLSPVFCWLIYRHSEEITRLFIRAWRKWSRVTDVLSDTIPGIRVVKAFNQEQREIGRFGERNEDVTAEFNRIHASWTKFWPLLMLGVHAMTVAVWVFAVPRLLGHGAQLPVGTFVSFLLYTTMFSAPIEVIGQMARTINRATTSAHRVFEVLDTEPEIRDVPEPIRLEPVHGRVTFEHVTFGYDGVRQVLRGVSFDAAPGE